MFYGELLVQCVHFHHVLYGLKELNHTDLMYGLIFKTLVIN